MKTKVKFYKLRRKKFLVSTFWDLTDGQPDMPESYKTVRYDLFAEGKRTKLTITFNKRNDIQEEVSNFDQNREMKMTLFPNERLIEN